MGIRVESSRWISHPAVDLGLISFGWIPLLTAFILVNLASDPAGWREGLLVVVLVVNFLHRHITFPLVYGDPQIFEQRRRAYLWLPVLFAVATVASVTWVDAASLVGEPMRRSISLDDKAFVTIGFWTDDQRSPPFKIDLGGASSPDEVRAAFERDLDGKLEVGLQGTSLTLALPADSADEGFILAGKRGGPTRKAIGLDGVDYKWLYPTRPLFTLLAALSVIWTIYHVLMQKYGLLRIYSRKSSQQSARNDLIFVFSWFFVVLLGLLATPSVRDLAASEYSQWEAIFRIAQPVLRAMPALAAISLAVAVVASVSFARAELAGELSLPKLAAVGSLLGLYAAMFWDPVAGYLLFGFSHSVEYLAFVNVFSRRKYLGQDSNSSVMAASIAYQPLAMGLFCVAGGGAYLLWYAGSDQTLEWYIVGSSFLHFIYDGWIWKVSKPAVSRPLGLA